MDWMIAGLVVGGIIGFVGLGKIVSRMTFAQFLPLLAILLVLCWFVSTDALCVFEFIIL